MRKMISFVSVAVLALFSFGGFTQAHPGDASGKVRGLDHHSKKVELSGGAEVPGPGDTDGSGMATLTLDHDKGEVCYDITVKDIQAPTAAHIHMGAAGKSGGVKVTFKKAADGAWKGCASADKAVIKDLLDNPANYYVNVHTADFPGGAIRGQLGK